MINGYDFNNLFSNPINNPLITQIDFSDLFSINLWNNSSRLWKYFQSFYCLKNINDKNVRITNGIAGNIICN